MTMTVNVRRLMVGLALTTVSCSHEPSHVAPSGHDLPRGYYKKLKALDTQQRIEAKALDAMSFGVSAADWEKQRLRPTYYLPPQPSLVNLPPPPANSSVQTGQELKYLMELQRQRSDEDIRSSLFFAGVWYNVNILRTDADYSRFQRNLFHIGRSIGTWFNAESLPMTSKLMANAWRDASYFIWHYKNHYDRIRPYKLESSLENLEDTDWPAYPSAHAGNSYVAAYIYSELGPEFSDIFMNDALAMAHSREIIGVHYPSDSEAGRVIAREVVNLLLNNSRFQQDLALARAEWQAVRSRSY
jgi:acid phosphatase (class A)